MITANEIRIGNWIKCIGKEFGSPRLANVVKVSCNDISFNEGNPDGACYPRAFDQYEAIPLTPEILINNCGFLEEINNYSLTDAKTKDTINVKWDVTDYCFYIDMSDVTGEDIIIEFLHQLQNIYYIFTGNELEITW